MSIQNVGPSLSNLANVGRTQTEQPSRAPVQRGHANAVPVRTQPSASPATRNAPGLGTPASGLPVEPPAGTDPELWSVLTADERAFFARAGAAGPLTYGRAAAPAAPKTPPMARGGRLDVRV
jgi:hypothetical protein